MTVCIYITEQCETKQNKLFVENGWFCVWCVLGKIIKKRNRKTGELLEEQRSHAANFALLFDEDLKVLVDDGHGQEDSRTGADGAQEVGHDGQASYAEAAEGSCCGDVPGRRKIMKVAS